MMARLYERTMNLLLSLLMVVLFILIAPFWALFYSGLLFKDYLGIVSA